MNANGGYASDFRRCGSGFITHLEIFTFLWNIHTWNAEGRLLHSSFDFEMLDSVIDSNRIEFLVNILKCDGGVSGFTCMRIQFLS